MKGLSWECFLALFSQRNKRSDSFQNPLDIIIITRILSEQFIFILVFFIFLSGMNSVYLLNIDGTDLYKIGFTRGKVQRRIKELQTGNPMRIVAIDVFESRFAIKVEKALHFQLSQKKYIPDDDLMLIGEWFKLDNNDISQFRERCSKIEQNFKFLEENSTLKLR